MGAKPLLIHWVGSVDANQKAAQKPKTFMKGTFVKVDSLSDLGFSSKSPRATPKRVKSDSKKGFFESLLTLF